MSAVTLVVLSQAQFDSHLYLTPPPHTEKVRRASKEMYEY